MNLQTAEAVGKMHVFTDTIEKETATETHPPGNLGYGLAVSLQMQKYLQVSVKGHCSKARDGQIWEEE